MAAKETTLNEIGEMLGYVVEHMATKEDIDRLDLRITKLDERVANIERELIALRHDLDVLSAKVENVIGYRKEIDHVLERVAAIEKHLGIQPQDFSLVGFCRVPMRGISRNIDVLLREIAELPEDAQAELVQAVVQMQADQLGIYELDEEQRHRDERML